MTGLANRALFHDRVTHALARQERDGDAIAVLFMDLDDFKTVNDSLGHAAGDEILRQIGVRLEGCLRTADTVARLGGDEFAVLLEDSVSDVEILDVASRIIEILGPPFSLEGREVFVRASVGIAVSATDGRTDGGAEELLRDADVAMYSAKENGKSRYQIFEPAMHGSAIKRVELRADLQDALGRGEFLLHYQPIVALDSGAVVGVEALVRWDHPVRGLVPPLDFISLAEESGMIVPLGRWVLAEASRTAVGIHALSVTDTPVHISVNLSARQLARPEIVAEVGEVLAETGLDPSSLVLEITESMIMQDIESSIELLGHLKELGVTLAIDDFGTGYEPQLRSPPSRSMSSRSTSRSSTRSARPANPGH